MSGEERAGVRAIEIPGMKITYQGPVSPDGKGLAFEAAVDATIATPDLDELLDRIGGALRRQAAIEEIPITKGNIIGIRKEIEMLSKARASAIARGEARLSVAGAARRRPQEMMMPSDQNAVAQHDASLATKEMQLAALTARLPYLEAIAAGREPPDIFPELREMPEAAD